MERSLWQLTDEELRDATEGSFRRLQEAEAAIWGICWSWIRVRVRCRVRGRVGWR